MDHFVDGFFVGWPFFSIAPVLICDLVSFIRYFQTFLKPFHLLFRTNVDPELAENRALAEQLFLKGIDFLVGPFPFLWFGKSLVSEGGMRLIVKIKRLSIHVIH